MLLPRLNLISSFLAFARSPSITEASESLGISQSAMTLHLQEFEKHFELDVFVMEGRKKTLTPFGQELCNMFAQKLDGLGDEVLDILQRYTNPKEATLRISGRTEIINFIGREISFLGNAIYKAGDGQTVVQDLLSKKTDLAISNHSVDSDKLVAKKLFSDHRMIAVPKKWIKQHNSLSEELVRMLTDKPYLQYKESDPLLSKLLAEYDASREIRPKLVLSDWPSLVDLVEKEVGWIIAPSRYEKLMTSRTAKFHIPASLLPPTDFFILYRKGSFDKFWFRPLIEQIKSIFEPSV